MASTMPNITTDCRQNEDLVQYTDGYSGVKLWPWRHGIQSSGAALGGSGAVAKGAKIWGSSETKVREITIFANLARKSRCWIRDPFPRLFGLLLDHSTSLRVSKRPVLYCDPPSSKCSTVRSNEEGGIHQGQWRSQHESAASIQRMTGTGGGGVGNECEGGVLFLLTFCR
jgi:hypothetical protein